MRESEEEKAVHVYNITAHDLYKGMENMYMASRNLRVGNIVFFCFYLCSVLFAFPCVSVSLCVPCVEVT